MKSMTAVLRVAASPPRGGSGSQRPHGDAARPVRRRIDQLRSRAVQSAPGLTATSSRTFWSFVDRSERHGDARALRDRRRPAGRARSGGPQDRRPVGGARAEPRRPNSAWSAASDGCRRSRPSRSGRRASSLTPEVIAKNRWYAFWDAPLVLPDGPEMREQRGDEYGTARRDRSVGAGGRARPRTGTAGAVLWAPGSAPRQVPALRRRRRARTAPADRFDPGGGLHRCRWPAATSVSRASEADIKRATASFNDRLVQREDRRRGARSDVPGPVDGHLRRRSAVHRLSRHQPAADGSARQDQRGMDRLQIRGGPERLLDRPDCRASSGATPAASRSSNELGGVVNKHARAGQGAEPACSSRKARADRSPPSRRRTRSSSRARRTPTSATCGTARTRPTAFGFGIRQAGARRGPAVRRQLRALQRAARHRAADGRVLLRQPGRGRGDAPGGAWRSRTATTFKPLPGYKTFVNHFHLDSPIASAPPDRSTRRCRTWRR